MRELFAPVSVCAVVLLVHYTVKCVLITGETQLVEQSEKYDAYQ